MAKSPDYMIKIPDYPKSTFCDECGFNSEKNKQKLKKLQNKINKLEMEIVDLNKSLVRTAKLTKKYAACTSCGSSKRRAYVWLYQGKTYFILGCTKCATEQPITKYRFNIIKKEIEKDEGA